MFKVIRNFQSSVEVIADYRSDVDNTEVSEETPKVPTHYGAGSTCFVIEDSSVWMLGNDAKWHELE